MACAPRRVPSHAAPPGVPLTLRRSEVPPIDATVSAAADGALTLWFEDGTSQQADLVVGTDGIYSAGPA